jgi:hypothetical protein
MSKIAVSSPASGTATYTISAPAGSTDQTLTLPDATGTVLVSGQPVTATTGNFSGDVTLGFSVLATPTGSAPSYTCRAWVNFNGTGTVAILASGNVSSITDLGTGSYRTNFTTAMVDANYAVCATANNGSSFVAMLTGAEAAYNSTSYAQINTASTNATFADARGVNVSIFR